MKFSLYILLAVLITGCAVDGEDVYESFDWDPDFKSHTDSVRIDPRNDIEIPCIYENNALHICLNEEVMISSTWHLIKDGKKIRYGTEFCQTLSSSGEYVLDCTWYSDPTNSTSPTVTGSINFDLDFCKTFCEVIQAFEPNGDGQYENWGVFHDGVAWGSITVENGNGTTVFSTMDFDETWDGTFEGNLAPSGTYSYLVKGAYKNGFLFEYRGELQLVR